MFRCALFGLLLLAGCPNPAQRLALQECQFTLRDISIKGYGPLEMDLLVTVGIHNPNDIDVIVDVLTYTAYINDKRLGSGETTQDVTIPRMRHADLPVSLKMNLVDVGYAGAAALRASERVLRVEATYWVELPWGRRPFPVSVSRRL